MPARSNGPSDLNVMQVEENFPIALIMVSPANEAQMFHNFLVDHDYYGLDKEKVGCL